MYTGSHRGQWQGQNKNLVLEFSWLLIAKLSEWPKSFASNIVSFRVSRSYSCGWFWSVVLKKNACVGIFGVGGKAAKPQDSLILKKKKVDFRIFAVWNCAWDSLTNFEAKKLYNLPSQLYHKCVKCRAPYKNHLDFKNSVQGDGFYIHVFFSLCIKFIMMPC